MIDEKDDSLKDFLGISKIYTNKGAGQVLIDVSLISLSKGLISSSFRLPDSEFLTDL